LLHYRFTIASRGLLLAALRQGPQTCREFTGAKCDRSMSREAVAKRL